VEVYTKQNILRRYKTSMELNKTFTNRQLETRDPNHLILVTSAWLKNNADKAALVEAYYDTRADRPTDQNFINKVKSTGYIHTPLFITDVKGVGEVVVAGRQRLKAALALGLPEVPVITHDPSVDLSIELELTENLARSENTVLESAHAFKKALQKGISKEKLSEMVGLSTTQVGNIIMVGELPKFILDLIDKGELGLTAAVQLVKTYGKKAPVGAGLIKVYDEESQKQMKEAVEKMSLEARLAGGGKISVRQARNSKPNSMDELTPRNWKAILEDELLPDDFRALIEVFIGKKAWQIARGEHPDSLYFLCKKEPTPKPKKEKVAKQPKKTKSTQPVQEEAKQESQESFDPAELFR
jgi:ParB/RepB/Spo0J family partition protein